MNIRKLTLLLLAGVSPLGIGSAVSFADELMVKDCNGMLRAAEEVTAGAPSSIKINFAQTPGIIADGVEVALFDSKGTKKDTAIVKDGEVTFSDLTAGTWRVCPVSDKLAFSNISIFSQGESSSTGGVVAAAAGILGGGAIVLGGSGGGSHSVGSLAIGDTVGTSGSGSSTSGSAASLGAGSATSGVSTSAARPLADAEGCAKDKPEDKPDPISPVS